MSKISFLEKNSFQNFTTQEQRQTKVIETLNGLKSENNDNDYSLSLSNEAKSLLSSNFKPINNILDKFYEKTGLEKVPQKELITQDAAITKEMIREEKKKSAEMHIGRDARNLLDAFHGGELIGQLPLQAISRMFEKRFTRYVDTLKDYVNEYGADKAFHERINRFLSKMNPDEDNAVANLIKEVTDKIFAGEEVLSGNSLNSKASEAFRKTFEKEIKQSEKADTDKREKIRKQLEATTESLKKNKEVLQDKIKKIRDQLQELKTDSKDSMKNATQIRQLEKELEQLQTQLNGVNEGLRNSNNMPPEGDWSDIGIEDW